MNAIHWFTIACIVLAVACALLLWFSYRWERGSKERVEEARRGYLRAVYKIEPTYHNYSDDGTYHDTTIHIPTRSVLDDDRPTTPLPTLPDVHATVLPGHGDLWREWEYQWPARDAVSDEQEEGRNAS